MHPLTSQILISNKTKLATWIIEDFFLKPQQKHTDRWNQARCLSEAIYSREAEGIGTTSKTEKKKGVLLNSWAMSKCWQEVKKNENQY